MQATLASAAGIAGVGILMAFAGVSGAPTGPSPLRPVWAEVKWPFPLDQWGAGKAFVCKAADCGARINLTVRPKVGYCNCATGVGDEAELERVSDNELVTPAPSARGRGRPIKIGWMAGFSRAYASADTNVISVAYNDECDVVIALATFAQMDATVVEPAVIDFLGSRPMLVWARQELGLEFMRRDW